MYWDALKGKKLVVVDASVILKWVLPEEQEENVLEALSLRDARAVISCIEYIHISYSID